MNTELSQKETLKNLVIAGLHKGTPFKEIVDEMTQYDESHHANPYFAVVECDSPFAGPDGNNPAAFVEQIFNSLNIDTEDSLQPNYGAFSLTHMTDFLGEPSSEVSWCIEDTLISGGLSLLASKPKVGKSTLAQDLAFSIATGGNFLGSLPTTQGPVVYLGLEDRRDMLREQLILRGFTGQEPIYVHVGVVSKEDWKPDLRTICLELKPRLLVIDHMSLLATFSDINDYSSVSKELAFFRQIARESDTHFLLLHHMRKSSTDNDGILGSTAVFGAVDTTITLSAEKGRRTIKTTCRYGKEIEESYLDFDPKSRTFKLGDKKRTATADEILDQVCRFITASERGITTQQIKNHIRAKAEKISSALKILLETGRVKRTGKGGSGSPYLYYGVDQGCSGSLSKIREPEQPWSLVQ